MDILKCPISKKLPNIFFKIYAHKGIFSSLLPESIIKNP